MKVLKYDEYEKTNEYFIGAIGNFFKNLFNKSIEDIKKIGEDPTKEQLQQWLEDNSFNKSSSNYIFKNIIDEYKKRTTVNVEDAIKLVNDILDPAEGVLGTSGMQSFYDGLIKAYGKNLSPVETVKYYINTIRNRAIVDYKYAGGPAGGKVDPAKRFVDLTNLNHLPDYKKVLTDDKSRKDKSIQWIESNLLPRLVKYLQEVKQEDVDKYLKSKNIEDSSDYSVDDEVYYLLQDKKPDWIKLSDEQKSKKDEDPAKSLIGSGKIVSISDAGIKIEYGENKFTLKTNDYIISKKEATDKNKVVTELKNKLGELKDDEDKMNKVLNFTEYLKTASEDDIAKINDIINKK